MKRASRVRKNRERRNLRNARQPSVRWIYGRRRAESAHSRRGPLEKWQVNGTEGGERKRLFTADRKSDPSPRRRQSPTSPFRTREQPLSPNPSLSHSPVSIHIPSVASPRYRIEESGHFSSCYEQCNPVFPSRTNTRDDRVGNCHIFFFLHPHAYFPLSLRDLGYFRRMQRTAERIPRN